MDSIPEWCPELSNINQYVLISPVKTINHIPWFHVNFDKIMLNASHCFGPIKALHDASSHVSLGIHDCTSSKHNAKTTDHVHWEKYRT